MKRYKREFEESDFRTDQIKVLKVENCMQNLHHIMKGEEDQISDVDVKYINSTLAKWSNDIKKINKIIANAINNWKKKF